MDIQTLLSAMTPAQLQEFIAKQTAAAAAPAAAPVAAPRPAPAAPAMTNDRTLNGLRSAVDPTSAGQSFSHPEGQALVNGRGKFDGNYEATIRAVEVKETKKGRIFKLTLEIDESDNELVTVGSTREWPLFQWVDAAVSETKGLVQNLATALGGGDPFTDQFYFDLIGPRQLAAGTRCSLEIFTAPQKKNPNKTFTNTRMRVLGGA